MKKAVEVEIMGQKFTVTSDADEDHVRKVAAYVNEKMEEVSSSSKLIPKFNVAMLAALNIADDYQKVKESHESILNRLDSLAKKISSTILTEEG